MIILVKFVINYFYVKILRKEWSGNKGVWVVLVGG